MWWLIRLAKKSLYRKRKESNLYQRNGRWHIDIEIEGKRIRKSYRDRNAARATLAELEKKRALIRMGALPSEDFRSALMRKKPRVFIEVVTEFMDDRRNNKESTKRSYNSNFNNHLLPVFGNMRIDQITESAVTRFKNSLTERNYSPSYINNILVNLSAVMEHAKRRKDISTNPVSSVKRCRVPKRQNKPLSFIEVEQVLSFVRAHWRPHFQFLCYTGVRPCELFALRWRNWDRKRGTITIDAARVWKTESSPKTASSARTFALTPRAREVLERLWDGLDVIDLNAKNAHVFLTPKGEAINTPGAMYDQWKKALANSGMEYRRPYELRHSFASNMLEGGLSINYLSRMLGHANPGITLSIYADVIQGTNRQNETRMNEILDSQFKAADEMRRQKDVTPDEPALIENV